MTTPATPRPAAGRALLGKASPFAKGYASVTYRGDEWPKVILAIEAEASAHADAQASLARLAAIEALAALRALVVEHDVVLPNCQTAQEARALLRQIDGATDG